ncbi:MAG: HAD family hydrolase [Candidatus Saccharimonadales bacterium]
MKNYQYILLDWDGNLAKTLDVWLEACRIPLEKRGLKLSDTEIAASFGIFEEQVKKWGLAAEVDTIADEADEIAALKLSHVELYPDALEVLGRLKELGKLTAVVTTSMHSQIKDALSNHNMLGLFDAIIAWDDTTNHKPHAEPIEKALEALGGSKEQAIMVGDTEKDILAGQNAGIDTVLYYPAEHTKFYNYDKLVSHSPTHVIEDFRKLIDIVGSSPVR